MVGTAIIKNFETGSYQSIRITFSEGESFEDIERACDVVSCLVDTDTKSISYDYGISSLANKLTMNELLYVAECAQRMWMENPHLTITRFVMRDGDCEMRVLSEKSGVYEMPDIWALYDTERRDVYRLIKTVDDRNILYASLLCESLNYAVCTECGIEEQLFGYSAGGIYINLALAEACSGGTMETDKGIRRLYSSMVKKHRRTMKRHIGTNETDFENSVSTLAMSSVVTSYRMYKTKVLLRVRELLYRIGKKECILSLADDDVILSYTDSMYESLEYIKEIIAPLFERPSHTDYITIRDLLLYVTVEGSRDSIRSKGRASSINFKLHSRTPCPDYYDSRGRAYWKKG